MSKTEKLASQRFGYRGATIFADIWPGEKGPRQSFTLSLSYFDKESKEYKDKKSMSQEEFAYLPTLQRRASDWADREMAKLRKANKGGGGDDMPKPSKAAQEKADQVSFDDDDIPF